DHLSDAGNDGRARHGLDADDGEGHSPAYRRLTSLDPAAISSQPPDRGDGGRRARAPHVSQGHLTAGKFSAVPAAVQGTEGGRAINRAKERVGHRVTGYPPFPSPPDGR